ncbi:cathepsin B-like [Anopheles darlingi]|uniref:cathepsin B-like n=1 Tax=Anopheles darlingi TaxID=43151 RepID=UPI0021002B83|nr:cathepsin B-like [Anopheles darlingi]
MGPSVACLAILALAGTCLATGSADSNIAFKLFVNNSAERSVQPVPANQYRDSSPYRSRYYAANASAGEYFRTGYGDVVNSQAAFVAAINNRTRGWKAGVNPLRHDQYRTGALLYEEAARAKLPQGIVLKLQEEPFPESFDARQKWSFCPSVGTIRNQGCCASSYAVAAVATITDRWCIHSEGKSQFSFGAYDVLSCCHRCGFGCDGGVPSAVWHYWVENGITSGGAYESHEGCQSYPFGVCKPQEIFAPHVDLICLRQCQPGYNTTYLEDKHFGRVAYSVPRDEDRILYELFYFGPVQASFTVYTDFIQYKSGVYRHTYGVRVGDHSVKIVGWGVENGTKFWLCANSWGAEWGENGFFKIIRGEDHLSVESNVVAGLPLFR